MWQCFVPRKEGAAVCIGLNTVEWLIASRHAHWLVLLLLLHSDKGISKTLDSTIVLFLINGEGGAYWPILTQVNCLLCLSVMIVVKLVLEQAIVIEIKTDLWLPLRRQIRHCPVDFAAAKVRKSFSLRRTVLKEQLLFIVSVDALVNIILFFADCNEIVQDE